MNVLSLFDGMSCGQVALSRSGIPVENYFASEIDKYAIQIAQNNFPNTVQLGDVQKWKEWNLPKIDLVMGGSPCQGFSLAGKGLNFDDPRSKLFFTFVDILKHINPRYFLLENVMMKKQWQDVITERMGVEPIVINSALVSAQNRKRLYWTNIPNVDQPEDLGVLLGDVIVALDDEEYVFLSEGTTKRFISYGLPFVSKYTGKARCLSAMEYVKNGRQGNYLLHGAIRGRYDEKGKIRQVLELKDDGKSNALTTVTKDNVVLVHNIYGGFKEKKPRIFKEKSPTIRTASGGGHIPSVFHGDEKELLNISFEEIRNKVRKLHPIECERLQTLPDNYTEGVSNTQRYKMIGNGWTIDVIAHILKNME